VNKEDIDIHINLLYILSTKIDLSSENGRLPAFSGGFCGSAQKKDTQRPDNAARKIRFFAGRYCNPAANIVK